MKPAIFEKTEVLPPENEKSPTGVFLPDLAKQVREEFGDFHAMEREAAWRGLRIGTMLIMGKTLCKHGEFTDWYEKAVPECGWTHGHRLMSLTYAFLQAKQIEPKRAFLLVADTDAPSQEMQRVEKTARSFIGEHTLNELFYEHGIKVKPQGKIGGARDKKRGKITHEMRVEAAKGSARNLIDLIHADVIKGKDWILCDRELLQNLHDVCMDAMKVIGAALKKSN